MTPSPRNCLTTPPSASTAATTSVKNWFSRRSSTAGSSCSLRAGEAANVLEQDADVAPLALQRHAAGEHRFRDIVRDEAAERVADQLALFEAVDHFVERLRDEPELIVPLDARAILQIAAQHFAHAGDQPLQRRDDAAGQSDADQQCAEQTGRADDDDSLSQRAQRRERFVVRPLHQREERLRQLRLAPARSATGIAHPPL